MSRISNGFWLGAAVATSLACEDGTLVGSRSATAGSAAVAGEQSSGGSGAGGTRGGETPGSGGMELREGGRGNVDQNRGGGGGEPTTDGGRTTGTGGDDTASGGTSGDDSGGKAGSESGGNSGATAGSESGGKGGGTAGANPGGNGGSGPQLARCDDNIRNGNESDVDCGGDCKACGGAQCESDGMCASNVCERIPGRPGSCRAVSCANHQLDAGESAVDCGGDCAACPGTTCELDYQCESRNCAGFCQASTCDDGVRNGLEKAVDCGGLCEACNGDACTQGQQCQSGVCANSACAAPSCSDGVQNGNEQAIDCGGACPACGGSACSTGETCASKICAHFQCTQPTCSDGVQNGQEQGVDCGSGCAACEDAPCQTDARCSSHHCIEGSCTAPSCSDTYRNGRESSVDCGGDCAPCDAGKSCWSNSDCESGVCRDDVCVASRCDDGVKNGDEREIDCGGSCAECSVRTACTSNEGCPSRRCDDRVCTDPPSCQSQPRSSCQGRGCCDSPIVSAGETWLGGGAPTNSESQVCGTGSSRATLHAYRLDRFKVTVRRFRKFVAAGPSAWKPRAGAGAHPLIAGSGWSSDWDAKVWSTQQELEASPAYARLTEADDMPMDGMSWYQAFAFCVWDGGRLPTEAEWEYAAVGGDESRPYPWGTQTPNAELAEYAPCLQRDCSPTRLNPVGSHWLGAGRFGQQDMVGSMGEWVLDYSDSIHSIAIQRTSPCDDCAILTDSGYRVIRGGYPDATDTRLCSSYRFSLPPTYEGSLYTGLRCARDL